MLEGFVFYDASNDDWILKTKEGESVNINSIIYAFTDLNLHFPDIDKLNGKGEYLQIAFSTIK